jgi:hypothetical protein
MRVEIVSTFASPTLEAWQFDIEQYNGTSHHASRYLLMCEALESAHEELVFTALERLSRDGGLYPWNNLLPKSRSKNLLSLVNRL